MSIENSSPTAIDLDNYGFFYGNPKDKETYIELVKEYPALDYLLRTYYGTPESTKPVAQQAVMVQEFQENKESQRFAGVLEDIERAIKNYRETIIFLNGLLGTSMTAEEGRDNLIDLSDQLQQKGAYDPKLIEQERKRDAFNIAGSGDRMKNSVSASRNFDFWIFKNKDIQLWQILLAGAVLILVGFGITFIPFLHSIGVIIIVAGCVLAGYAALSILMLNRALSVGIEDDDEDDDDEEETSTKPGLFGRFRR